MLMCERKSEMKVVKPGMTFGNGIPVPSDDEKIFKFKPIDEIANYVVRRVVMNSYPIKGEDGKYTERIRKAYYYFFNKNGIFCELDHCDPKLKSADIFNREIINDDYDIFKNHDNYCGTYLPDTSVFLQPPHADASFLFRKIACSYMEPGMTLDDFERQMNYYRFAAYGEKGIPCITSHFFGIERDVTKVYKPDFRRQGKNTKVFDYIIVDINIRTNIEDKPAFIRKNVNKMAMMALDRIKNDYRFKRYDVPIGILKLDKVYRIEDASVEFIFELKDELREMSL